MYANHEKTEEYIQDKTKEELELLLWKYGPRDRRLVSYRFLGFYLDVLMVKKKIIDLAMEEIILSEENNEQRL